MAEKLSQEEIDKLEQELRTLRQKVFDPYDAISDAASTRIAEIKDKLMPYWDERAAEMDRRRIDAKMRSWE